MAKPKVQPTVNMVAMARELHDYQTQIKNLEDTAKLLEEKATAIEKDLVALIVETYQEIGENGEPKDIKGRSFDIDDKYKAIMSTKPHPSIIPGMDVKVHAWLVSKGYPSSVKPYVFPQTLKMILGEIAESKKCDIKDVINTELLDSMTCFTDKKISFRKKT